MATLTVGAGSAYAQTGGTPGGTTTPSDTTAQSSQSSGSWTTYKSATWYGPGFWGMSTACGTMLTKTTIGVAHKRLPCGTVVINGTLFVYYGGGDKYCALATCDFGKLINHLLSCPG